MAKFTQGTPSKALTSKAEIHRILPYRRRISLEIGTTDSFWEAQNVTLILHHISCVAPEGDTAPGTPGRMRIPGEIVFSVNHHVEFRIAAQSLVDEWWSTRMVNKRGANLEGLDRLVKYLPLLAARMRPESLNTLATAAGAIATAYVDVSGHSKLGKLDQPLGITGGQQVELMWEGGAEDVPYTIEVDLVGITSTPIV